MVVSPSSSSKGPQINKSLRKLTMRTDFRVAHLFSRVSRRGHALSREGSPPRAFSTAPLERGPKGAKTAETAGKRPNFLTSAEPSANTRLAPLHARKHVGSRRADTYTAQLALRHSNRPWGETLTRYTYGSACENRSKARRCRSLRAWLWRSDPPESYR